jgi:hypothetical protein
VSAPAARAGAVLARVGIGVGTFWGQTHAVGQSVVLYLLSGGQWPTWWWAILKTVRPTTWPRTACNIMESVSNTTS